MISARSTLTRCLVGGRRGTQNVAAAFLQTPLPSVSSDHREKPNSVVVPASVRHLSSPAYRRHLRKKAGDIQAFQPAISASREGIQVPSKEVAGDMGWGFSQMENEPLLVIAEMGNHKAREEVLTRHIMTVDKVDYHDARDVLQKIAAKNREGLTLDTLPYKTAMVIAIVTGFGAIPMVFDIDVAMWFNEKFVTMEIPPPDDLDTQLETGAWTWNWMEPVLGTASYTLLCMQVARQNMQHLGMKPYSSRLIERRARLLCQEFPRYGKKILHSFVETDPMVRA